MTTARTESTEEFWEAHYLRASPTTNGRPTAALARFTDGEPPSTALELGCGKGDDAVWLARRGWRVTAVDVSDTALRYAADNATRAGVSGSIRFRQHELASSFPPGQFGLVTALFLHSPTEFPRLAVLRRAADAVGPAGLFLVVEHGSRAPWSWSAPGTVYPTAAERLSSLSLDAASWWRVFVGAIERHARGPDGASAVVKDTVVALRRASSSDEAAR